MPVQIEISLHVYVDGYKLSRRDSLTEDTVPGLYATHPTPPDQVSVKRLMRLLDKARPTPAEQDEIAELSTLTRYYAAGKIAAACNWWAEELASVRLYVGFAITEVILHCERFELNDEHGRDSPFDKVYTYEDYFTANPGTDRTAFRLAIIRERFLRAFRKHQDPGAGAVYYESLFSGAVDAEAKHRKIAHEIGHVLGLGHMKDHTRGIMSGRNVPLTLPYDKDKRGGDHDVLRRALRRRHGDEITVRPPGASPWSPCSITLGPQPPLMCAGVF